MTQAITLQDIYTAFDAFEAVEGRPQDEVESSCNSLSKVLSGYVAHQGMVSSEHQELLESLAEKSIRVLKMTKDFCLKFSPSTEEAENIQNRLAVTEEFASLPQGIEPNFLELVAVKSDQTLEEALTQALQAGDGACMLQQAIKADAVFSALRAAAKERNANAVEATLEEFLAIQEKALPSMVRDLDQGIAFLQEAEQALLS